MDLIFFHTKKLSYYLSLKTWTLFKCFSNLKNSSLCVNLEKQNPLLFSLFSCKKSIRYYNITDPPRWGLQAKQWCCFENWLKKWEHHIVTSCLQILKITEASFKVGLQKKLLLNYINLTICFVSFSPSIFSSTTPLRSYQWGPLSGHSEKSC